MTYTTLQHLPEGAIFETREGILAVKSEYHYGNEPGSQCQCVLLASGEYAHFPLGNAEPVREIDLEGALAELSTLRASLALAARDDESGKAELGAAVERGTYVARLAERMAEEARRQKAAGDARDWDGGNIAEGAWCALRAELAWLHSRGPTLPLPDAGEVERLRATLREIHAAANGDGPNLNLSKIRALALAALEANP